MDPPIQVVNLRSMVFTEAVTFTLTLVGAESCNSNSRRSLNDANNDPPPATTTPPNRSFRASTSHLFMVSNII